MKKIAIITIYGETNYGNKLQNYAVCHYLESLGFACETLVVREKKLLKDRCKSYLKSVMCKWVINSNELNRELSFKEFSKNFIPTRFISNKYSLEKLSNEYDYFVVGSDQVWNPCFGNYEKYYSSMFLMFAPSEKKVCFSPSFGVSQIPDEWIAQFKTGLESFKALCVREEEGAEIIKNITGQKAVCLIDPTMMFDASEWLKVASRRQNNKYYFSYFLGEKNISSIPKDLEIIDIMDKINGNYYSLNPSDFIALISNAEAVYTDSFHACVFSILFGKPFMVCERNDNNKGMSSRITTLFRMFGVDYDVENPQLIVIDPEIRDRVLVEKRNQVKEFLLSQMK